MMNKEEKSYTQEDLLLFIHKLKSENVDLLQRIDNAKDVVKEIKLHYQQHPTMIPSVKIHRLDEILGGKE